MDTSLKIKNYYNAIAKNYDYLYLDYISKAENKIVADMLMSRILSLNKNTVRILDLGCGTGLAFELIEKSCLKKGIVIQYFGMDISDNMISLANKKHGINPNCKFVVGNMTDLEDINSNSFDLVTSIFGSFSHSSDYKKTLNEIKRILIHDGLLFLMIYSRFSFRNISSVVFNGNWKKVLFKQTYDVRNNDALISCQAFFFWKWKIKKLLKTRSFKVDCVSGLNIIFECKIFKPLLRTNKNAFRALRIELKFGRLFPDLGHSMIVEAICKKGL